MIDIMKQGLGQARPNKTAFAKQRTPQWGFQAAERSALADGGALPRQVPAGRDKREIKIIFPLKMARA